jgi:flagellar basal body P-ring formation protein FlgA
MFPKPFILVALLLMPAGAGAGTGTDGVIAALIAASVSAQLGAGATVTVDVLQLPLVAGDPVSASLVPGARFGVPARFLIKLADGRQATVVARVDAAAAHAVAARNLERDATLDAADIDWVDGSLKGQLVAPLPAATAIVGARARRAIVQGEIVSLAVVRPAEAIRAGDAVTIVIRSGPIEVRGPGRAVNGGTVGDPIRVLRPGSRQPLSGRIVAPAVVEISK